jgi:hypothetical protein
MQVQEVAKVIMGFTSTMTTAQIVKQFRDRGRLELLKKAIEFLPRGEQLAFTDCLELKIPKQNGINTTVILIDDKELSSKDMA